MNYVHYTLKGLQISHYIPLNHPTSPTLFLQPSPLSDRIKWGYETIHQTLGLKIPILSTCTHFFQTTRKTTPGKHNRTNNFVCKNLLDKSKV